MADYVQRGTIGRPQHRTERPGGWTQTKRTTFLNHLAATCNVAKACEAAGMSTPGAYLLRRRDDAFAVQWRAALMTGYDRLEAALLEHATRALTLVEHGEVPDVPFDPEMAMRILAQHHARLSGRARQGGAQVKRATPQETDAAILKQLAALDRRMKGKAAR